MIGFNAFHGLSDISIPNQNESDMDGSADIEAVFPSEIGKNLIQLRLQSLDVQIGAAHVRDKFQCHRFVIDQNFRVDRYQIDTVLGQRTRDLEYGTRSIRDGEIDLYELSVRVEEGDRKDPGVRVSDHHHHLSLSDALDHAGVFRRDLELSIPYDRWGPVYFSGRPCPPTSARRHDAFGVSVADMGWFDLHRLDLLDRG